MRKFLALAAAASALFAASAARADVVLVDNFDQPSVGFQSAVDITPGGATPVFSSVYNIPSGNGIALTRQLAANCLTYPIASFQGCTYAAVGSDGTSNGVLTVGATSGNTGVASVFWTIPSFTLGNPASYFFNVVASNPQGTSIVDFTFSGVGGNFSLLGQNFGSGASTVNFGLLAGQAAIMAQGGQLQMNVQGGPGWNATLDQFSVGMPEPTSLALVGLALVGAGVVSRRRKA